ncbi:ribosome biogenesis GTPase YlqF [Burkholderiales bacterium]|nr:ribosome biogenesis GTPase YlqF [Burkholderiales bacterium]
MALINWFPGHMAQAKRNLSKALASVDVVVEVLDARMPAASMNPLFDELRQERQRPALKILNKADIADQTVTARWVEYFMDVNSLASALPIVGKSKQDVRKIIEACQKLAPHRVDAIKPLRLMVSGVPNVGKSTILNGLLGQAKAKAADEPAITKMINRYEVSDELIIYDSPGVMWPKVDTEETGLLLAVNNAIGVNAYNVEDAAIFLIEKMLERYPQAIADRYKVKVNNIDAIAFIELVGDKRGMRSRGGSVDFERAAQLVVTDYRHGRYGRVSLQLVSDLT